MEQRICIKFCVKNRIKCNKVCKMLTKAYGESAMSKARIYEWYKRFQEGRKDVEDDERPGRPSTSTTDENVEKVKEMVTNNRQLTVREVADDVGISIGSCHDIFANVFACGYEKDTLSECNTQGEMTGNDKLKANNDSSCEQNGQITKKCKAKGVKPIKSKGRRRNRQ